MINLNYFKTVFPDQPRLVETIIDLTVAEYPQFKRDLKRCTRNDDRESLRKMAHKWQYTAKILGLDDLWNTLDIFRDCKELRRIELNRAVCRVLDQLEVIIEDMRSSRVAL